MSYLYKHLLLTAAAATAVLTMPALAQDKSMQLHQAMTKSMKDMHAMPMSGDIDKDFAMMMKHHHQSGVEMARIQLQNGKDPEMRQKAQEIIKAQTKEIAELDRWLQTKGSGGTSSGTSGSGSGGSGPSSSSSGSDKGADHSGHKAAK